MKWRNICIRKDWTESMNLHDFRKTLRGQLENITFVEADGSLTPLRTLRKKDN